VAADLLILPPEGAERAGDRRRVRAQEPRQVDASGWHRKGCLSRRKTLTVAVHVVVRSQEVDIGYIQDIGQSYLYTNKVGGQSSLLRLSAESDQPGSYSFFVKFMGSIPARVRLDIDVYVVSSSDMIAQEERDRKNTSIIARALEDIRKVVDERAATSVIP
jgi:hypothetical protein